MSDKKKILVVDDEEDIRVYFSRMLEENGYDAVVASDGHEAHEKVKEEKPDLISLDMSMPNKSGIRFYKEIRESEETKGIPVIVVTGITSMGKPEDFQKFIESRSQFPPPDGFIAKPVDQEEFLGLVGKLTQ